MVHYVFEDNPQSTISLFFKKLYSEQELKRIHFVGSNKNLSKYVLELIKDNTEDYVIVYMDLVPSVPVEISIYKKLCIMSHENDNRVIVFPIPCFEYYLIKSLREIGISEADKQSIDICIDKVGFSKANILSNPKIREKCNNFERFCKQVLALAFMECVDVETINGKISPIGRKYYSLDCICLENVRTKECKECSMKKKVMCFLRQFPMVPSIKQLGNKYRNEITLQEIWDIHKKLVREFNEFQDRICNNEEIQYIKEI